MADYVMFMTVFHTAISIVGLVYGWPAIRQLFKPTEAGAEWLRVFIWLAVLCTFTGFLFPLNGFTPALGTGIVTTVIFGLMWVAHKRGWRKTWAGCVVAQVYFLAFVTIVQGFLKVPAFHVYAPTGSEPPFAVAQALTLGVFVLLGVFAIRAQKQPVRKGRKGYAV